MEKKSLLEFLDEVAKENSFDKGFIYATNFANVADMDPIIKEAGKRYVKQYLNEAAENAYLSVKDHSEMDTLSLVASRKEARKYEVNKLSIYNIEIDV